ncbi:MAG: C39 family peptidase [Lentisphaeria bacterium]|nr:C39 family peptidase [Candidatus Neomarinimicrobiota bacterium]MCF7842502.1 C39 family peptidase [Lentisphaeria bacterium]
MFYNKLNRFFISLSLLLAVAYGAHPDQFLTWPDANTVWQQVASSQGVINTGENIQLADNALSGYVIFNPVEMEHPFNEVIASWNGSAPESQAGFRVFVRFPWNTGWSPWLEIGFWQTNYWSGTKTTSYAGGYINIDTGILYYDRTEWQAKVEFQRDNTSIESPTLRRFSMQVSDEASTDNYSLTNIIADNPPQIFVPTQFIYQIGVDPEIGGRICSPTTTAMILASFGQTVDMLEFAWDTYDPYYHIFGVWPRAVQSASRYGVEGYVNRYRTWSEAYEVLATGGRIAMSIGQPLYSGHLLMLAGFTSNGQPIVHDPARSNGYSYVYNKSSISQAWFAKGGVAYTFFPESATALEQTDTATLPAEFTIDNIFPNPFNASTRTTFTIPEGGQVWVNIYNLRGQRVMAQKLGTLSAGSHNWHVDAAQLSSGVYHCQFQFTSITGQTSFVTQKISIVR